ncbi:MAG: AAA family ATPase [Bacteroidaceae bacterium]|jgi:predicted ATPase|nr:AAA family ATPase [Bacteroidaceae bacterium]
MIYLDSCRFPSFEKEDNFLANYFKTNSYSMNTIYPFKVLSERGLYSLDFKEITILYGGNGSGKSTALNTIGNLLGVARNSAYNKGDFHDSYLNMCDYRIGDFCDHVLNLRDKTTLITSDDIFKYMLDMRQNNGRVRNYRDNAIQQWFAERNARITRVNFETGEGVNELRRHQRARQQNCKEYLRENLGEVTPSYSNGETGFMKFIESIVPDRLYILDEPENSLSCELQMKLAQYIENSARYCGCQFIIATHSPFLLAMHNAKIYNLDSNPATISEFWELPNMRLYYELFLEYSEKFA